MKQELKVLKYNMINNLIISIIKISGGVLFKLESLYADGMHTFSDFITDIVSIISSKITKKRPTKYHPTGFGQVEYLTNIFVGMFLFGLATFITFNSIIKHNSSTIPPMKVLYVLLISFILKLISIIVTNKVGKRINSNVLITSVQESKTDLYSTIGVIIITILLQYSNEIYIFKYSDLIGSIIIGIIIYKTALTIIISNSLSIIGEIELNEEINTKVINYLSKYKNIEDQKIELMKYGPYYKLNLTLVLDEKITLKQASKILTKIKSDIIHNRSLKIKYVTIYIVDKL